MLILVLFGLWILPVGCGSGGGSTPTTSPTSSLFFEWGLPFFYGNNVYTSITPNGNGSYFAFSSYTAAPSGTNVQPIYVNGGPDNYINGAFTSVTVCVPNSPTTCQTIDNVLVDTGSVGLRLLSSALTLTLPPEQLSGNNLGECVQFADLSYVWGPIQLATVTLGGTTLGGTGAGLTTPNMPIHVLNPDFPTPGYAPSDCESGMTTGEEDTLQFLGANGILGLGSTQYDCSVGGTNYCVSPPQQAAYYTCTSSACTDTILNPSLQVQNPVALFSTDNNGVIIEFPPVSSPMASLEGWLVFGISAPPTLTFTLDSNGLIYTTFNGNSDMPSFFDSGSNGYFFPDTSILTDSNGWYIPTNPDTLSFTATIKGYNGNSSSVSFSVSNADVMFNAYPTTYNVFNNLAGSL
jgi:hypothetical protein